MTTIVNESIDIDAPVRCPLFDKSKADPKCKGCECEPICKGKRGEFGDE